MRSSLVTALVGFTLAAAVTGCSGEKRPVAEVVGPWDEVTADTTTDDPGAVAVATVAALRPRWSDLAGASEGDPLLAGGVVAVDEADGSALEARCGDERLDGETLSGNAVYCPADDSIILDVNGLGRTLLSRHGFVGVALVSAHELGHALQTLGGNRLDPVLSELQADCWAGDFAAGIVAGEVDGWSLSRRDLAGPARVLLDLRDAPGTTSVDDGAHGTGFDRVSAFLDGLYGRRDRCLSYQDDPPVLTGQPFADAEEELTGGRRPISELVPLARQDLDEHFRHLAESISLTWSPTARIDLADGVGCGDGNVVALVQICADRSVIVQRPPLQRAASTGDAAVMAVLARAWAREAVLHTWSDVFSLEAGSVDCLVGYWLGSHHPAAPTAASYPYVLPPGALDEVVDAMLKQPATDPLERLRALLDGFHHGRQACEIAPSTTTTRAEKEP